MLPFRQHHAELAHHHTYPHREIEQLRTLVATFNRAMASRRHGAPTPTARAAVSHDWAIDLDHLARVIEPDVEPLVSEIRTTARIHVLRAMGEDIAARELRQHQTTIASQTPGSAGV